MVIKDPRRILDKVLHRGGGGGVAPSEYQPPPPPPPPPPSEVQPLTLIYTIFDGKGISFIPSIHKWYPFHIPSLELCIPFTAVSALSFKFEYIKTECFSIFSQT